MKKIYLLLFSYFSVALMCAQSLDTQSKNAHRDNSAIILGEVYPNPFHNFIAVPVICSDSGVVRIKLFDLIGNLVSACDYEVNKATKEISINLISENASDPGIYFLRLQAGDETRTMRMLRK